MSTLDTAMRRLGKAVERRDRADADLVEAVRGAYEAGAQVTAIASAIGFSRRGAYLALARWGIPLRGTTGADRDRP